MSRTINLGNYESIRYEIGFEVPCPHTDEGLNAGYDRAVNFTVTKMMSEVASTGSVPKVIGASGQTATPPRV